MKKIFLCLLVFIFGFTPSLHAQLKAATKTAQVARKTVTSVRLSSVPGSFVPAPSSSVNKAATNATKNLSAVSATSGAAVSSAVSKALTPSATAARTQRSWIEQMKRNWKAAQLKKQHTAQVRLAEIKANLPQLSTQASKEVSSFAGLEFHEVEISRFPVLPWIKEPGVLYRGLGLSTDGETLRNILENGLLLKDVGPDSNALAMMFAGGSRGAVRQVANMRFTNLTNDPTFALHYAQRNNAVGSIMVMIRVTGQPEYDTIVRVGADIAPEQIEEMIALVSLDGTPTWCRVELQEGNFRLTPYQTVSQE